MEHPEMSYDGHAGGFEFTRAELEALDDINFESMMAPDSDPALTQGLGSLGNCNKNDSCLDQRCMGRYTDPNMGFDATFHHHFGNTNPMPSLQGHNLQDHTFDLSLDTVDYSNLQTPNQNQSQNHNETMRNQNLYGANQHNRNNRLQQNIAPPILNHPFHQPWNCGTGYGWESLLFQATPHLDSRSYTNPFGTHITPQQRFDECASMACSSNCDPNCWSQCGETQAVCCTEATCLEGTQSVCCFDDSCSAPPCFDEPCDDEECNGAVRLCTDATCAGPGTTVASTPASASIKTPPTPDLENTTDIMSPVEPGNSLDHLFRFPPTPKIKRKLDSISRGSHHDNCFVRPTEPRSAFGTPFSRQETPGCSTSQGTHSFKEERQSMGVENQFTCCWVGPTGRVCGKQLENDEQLQNHCKSEHLMDLAKIADGYRCGWQGCKRTTTFSQKSKLERHMQTHTGFKPVKCTICGISLSAKQSLEQHMRIHSGEKPWKCTYPNCTQSFKQQSALTMHERTHTGEKPLKCDICGKRFGESSNLSKHRRIHNQKGAFFCKHCGKDFHRQDQLRRHMTSTHSDKSDKVKDNTKGEIKDEHNAYISPGRTIISEH
ncbi:Fc.00g064020.m01.CDS01 [Cosmosporella sp. VM-42]